MSKQLIPISYVGETVNGFVVTRQALLDMVAED